MKDITLLAIDLAKDVFQLHGINKHGKKILEKRVSRAQLPNVVSNLPSCTIAIEACGSSNYWARKFKSFGHAVIQLSPQHVKPFVKGNKNDKNDARAISIAAQQVDMPTVPIKTIEQQEIQMNHRYRESLVSDRVALANRMRGYLREVGVFITKGLASLRKSISLILEDALNELTIGMREILSNCYERLLALDEEILIYTQKIEEACKSNEVCKKLMSLPGVGPMIASIVFATVGQASHFKNGRHFSAFLGLVPKEHSSGNSHRLLSISKRGNNYIRSLLIHGGRSIVQRVDNKNDGLSRWIQRIKKERGYNKASVALANKNARHIWAIMAYGDEYINPFAA